MLSKSGKQKSGISVFGFLLDFFEGMFVCILKRTVLDHQNCMTSRNNNRRKNSIYVCVLARVKKVYAALGWAFLGLIGLVFGCFYV